LKTIPHATASAGTYPTQLIQYVQPAPQANVSLMNSFAYETNDPCFGKFTKSSEND
jgi:hypothetical protein